MGYGLSQYKQRGAVDSFLCLQAAPAREGHSGGAQRALGLRQNFHELGSLQQWAPECPGAAGSDTVLGLR